MTSGARRKVTLERSFEASIEEVWDLWTTKEGIESWWGPDGFVVTVQKLDLRPGGEPSNMTASAGPDRVLEDAGAAGKRDSGDYTEVFRQTTGVPTRATYTWRGR